jgi:hypothetical protein
MATDFNTQRNTSIGVGLVLGAGVGLALGTAFDNPGVGLAIGPAVGLAIALAWQDGRRRRTGGQDSAPRDAAQDDERGLEQGP